MSQKTTAQTRYQPSRPAVRDMLSPCSLGPPAAQGADPTPSPDFDQIPLTGNDVNQHRPALLAAIDRRLWRDLGFADPEPEILRFLPMLVVAWADGRITEDERETVAERARPLPEHLQAW